MFESHLRPRDDQPEPTVDDLSTLDNLEQTAVGTAAETAMKHFVEGMRTGLYQMRPRVEDPEKAAITSAMGMLCRTATEISKGKLPNAQQAMLVLDPPDGPGAGANPKIADVSLTGVPKELTAATLLGLATNHARPLPQTLRVAVIVPIKATGDLTNLTGTITSMYCYRTLDNQIKLGGLLLRLEKRDGKWVTANEVETVTPDEQGTWPQVLRGMLIVNQAIIPVHSKFRIKEKP